MAILKSKSGSSYDTETGIRTNADGTTTQVNTINSDVLKGSTSKLELPETGTTYNQNLSGMMNGVVAGNKIDTQYSKDQADYAKTQTQTDDIYKQLIGLNTDEGNVNQTVDRTAENEARKQADKYTSQIEQLQKSTRDTVESLRKNNPQGMSTGALNSKINDIERESLSKQADLALLQSVSVRDYSTLNSIAEQQVQNNLAQIKAKKENLQLFISKLDKTEQRQYDSIQKQVDREYETKEKNENLIADIKKNVVQSAGTKASSILNQLSTIDTSKPDAYTKALQIAGSYSISEADRLDLEIKRLNKNKLDKEISEIGAGSNKLLSVAEAQAAGVPYGTTEAQLIAQGGQPKFDIKKAESSIQNIERLKKATNEALKLYKSSGVGGIKKIAGDLFIGDTKFRQLENLSNTVKVNILTMNTDPNIKKFFGPQMTERDTELMTGAGTVLNPNSQSPEQFKAEAEEILNMFSRAEAEVRKGIEEENTKNYFDSSATALQVTGNPFSKGGYKTE